MSFYGILKNSKSLLVVKLAKHFSDRYYNQITHKIMNCAPTLKLPNVIHHLENFADLKLAEPWDNVGLLIEPTIEVDIKTVLLTNDLTENVMKEALNSKANFIISYHPPIFKPLKRITMSNWKEKIVATCIENKIAVYSPHTAWDATIGGVADWLIAPFHDFSDENVPVAIIPTAHEISHYYYMKVAGFDKDCSEMNKIIERGITYSSNLDRDGYVTYKNIVTKQDKDAIESTAKAVNVKFQQCSSNSIGIGRMINVHDLTFEDCIKAVKVNTDLKNIRIAVNSQQTSTNLEFKINRIGVVPGSGGSVLNNIDVDLFITGEMQHHDILEANHRGISIILTNHSDSERGFLKYFKNSLIRHMPSVTFKIASSDNDPCSTV